MADASGATVVARIARLDEVVVNRIAAGEILHRPANAIKEMIENSIDAKATSVQVTVKDGGMKLLQIQDNGHGILREDMPIVCERFTTSKLRKFEDLNSIGTYGFRGEALASISHVAHVTITTKTADSNCAWRASYKDGKMVGDAKPCAGTTGTIITVEDMFYNVATRRKALTSYADEYNRIVDVMSRYAVHNVGVGFHLKKHGATVADVSTTAATSRLDTIRALYGAPVARELLPVEHASPNLQFKATAYITNANFNVKKFTFLLFINHRAVESANLKRAIEAVYATYLPKGTHPFVYLALDIAPEHVDVNVHPTKQEVHFLHEDAIIEQVCTSVQQKLLNANASRTFFTQALLPGAAPPIAVPASLSSWSSGATAAAGGGDKGAISGSAAAASPATPRGEAGLTTYAYEKVRTDNRSRNIEAFVTRGRSGEAGAGGTRRRDERPPAAAADDDDDDKDDAEGDVYAERLTRRLDERAPKRARTDALTPAPAPASVPVAAPGAEETQPAGRTPVTLTSVLELRQAVVDSQHAGILGILRDHFFVGCVNDYLALVQHQTKLYIVNYRELSRELFYQLALREFSNFGRITLSTPAPIAELVQMALDMPEAGWTEDDGPMESLAEAVVKVLSRRRDMLAEYFCIGVDEHGRLTTLPVILKGYLPNLDSLPMFLLRMGSEVDWADEKLCLEGVCQQLGWLYGLTPPLVVPSDPEEQHQAARREYRWQVEHVLFPALRYYFVPPKRLADSGEMVQVADLPDLYKVFERC